MKSASKQTTAFMILWVSKKQLHNYGTPIKGKFFQISSTKTNFIVSLSLTRVF